MGRDASKQLTIHVCNLIFTTCNLATTIEVLLKQYGKKDFPYPGYGKAIPSNYYNNTKGRNTMANEVEVLGTG